MQVYNVRCPLCSGSETTVEIPDSWAIFRVEGYQSDPNRRWERLEPDPDRVYGVRNFISKQDQRRLEADCNSGHTLRIFAASYKVLGEEDALYGPSQTPMVSCMHCGYDFGPHDTFNRRETFDPANHQILRSISTTSQPGHNEEKTLTREACMDHDRISVRNECPNCGKSVFFNYRSRRFDDDTNYLGHREAETSN